MTMIIMMTTIKSKTAPKNEDDHIEEDNLKNKKFQVHNFNKCMASISELPECSGYCIVVARVYKKNWVNFNCVTTH